MIVFSFISSVYTFTFRPNRHLKVAVSGGESVRLYCFLWTTFERTTHAPFANIWLTFKKTTRRQRHAPSMPLHPPLQVLPTPLTPAARQFVVPRRREL